MAAIKQLLLLTTTSLAQQSPTARLDAEVLLCHTLNKPRSFLYSHSEAELSTQQQQNHNAFITRRQQGEPIAYITGQKDFWDMTLKITPDVLIPRPMCSD